MNADELLNECRRKFGPAPRRFSLIDRFSYLTVQRPNWCREDEPLSRFFTGQRRLTERGEVVWGHVVQANSLLYKRSRHNCPGEVVYCLDPRVSFGPDDLASIARSLYMLKGVPCDASELQFISDYLANERKRVFGLEVPKQISPSVPCAITTVYFERRHLPDGVLSSTVFPLLVSPTQPRIAMVLPSRYWPEELCGMWGRTA